MEWNGREGLGFTIWALPNLAIPQFWRVIFCFLFFLIGAPLCTYNYLICTILCFTKFCAWRHMGQIWQAIQQGHGFFQCKSTRQNFFWGCISGGPIIKQNLSSNTKGQGGGVCKTLFRFSLNPPKMDSSRPRNRTQSGLNRSFFFLFF